MRRQRSNVSPATPKETQSQFVTPLTQNVEIISVLILWGMYEPGVSPSYGHIRPEFSSSLVGIVLPLGHSCSSPFLIIHLLIQRGMAGRMEMDEFQVHFKPSSLRRYPKVRALCFLVFLGVFQ